MKLIRPNNLPIRSSIFTLLYVVCLAVALVLVPGGQPTLARLAAEQGGGAPQAALGTSFTYQGQLKDGGNPANGQYDFRFNLYDALTGGTQVGTTQTVAGQTVSEGLFTVSLDFGANVFQGDARWLEIAVRQAGGGTYTTLSPRQPLTAVPYAMSLATGSTGAVISGTVPGPTLIVTNSLGIGLQGTSTNGNGGYFVSTSSGIGVLGQSSSGVGVNGSTNSASLAAVLGQNANAGPGVQGISNSGRGIDGSSESGYGVVGASNTGTGVFGSSINSGTGVRGASDSSYGGYFTSNSGYGGYFTSGSGTGLKAIGGTQYGYMRGVDANGSTGVYATGIGAGVYAQATDSQGIGVYGVADNGTSAWGVGGSSLAGIGVKGESSGNLGIGVAGTNYSSDGWATSGINDTSSVYARGVVAGSDYGYAIYGRSNFGWAGWFDGNVNVTGSCCAAAAGSFKIDDPLDPANKYLVQSAVQSADMMSIYNGNVSTDARGEAVVSLPDYVEALNSDFRYQLTPVGQFAQAIVASEIKNNSFTIKTDKPNVKVSWQVTGIRKDPYAQAHPIQPEAAKPADEKGLYLHPELYGQPDSKGIGYEDRQRLQDEWIKAQKPKP